MRAGARRFALLSFVVALVGILCGGEETDRDLKARPNNGQQQPKKEASTSKNAGGGPQVRQPEFPARPNVLLIMTDQQRFDALRFVQDEMPQYRNQFKLRTPNIDRLATSGVYFRNAYCHSPQCVPSRSTIRTGCTIERTGLQDGSLKNNYAAHPQFKEKVERLMTYDRILVEKRGYVAENYGRFDLPDILYFGENKKADPVVRYNDYEFNMTKPRLTIDRYQRIYRSHVDYRAAEDGLERKFVNGQQDSGLSAWPYQPLQLDARFGKPAGTPIEDLPFGADQVSSSQFGPDLLPANYSNTAITGEMSLRALKRLAAGKQPFCLTVNLWNPHPPSIVDRRYFDYYFPRRSSIMIPKNLLDEMKDSAYIDANKRLDLIRRFGYNDPIKVQEWTAAYYGMVEEIDDWVGMLLAVLHNTGLRDNTLVIFTSDHGEMLGAHAMRNKGVLLEEAIRVPLIMSFPGKIPRALKIDQPVGHLDLFATMMDYTGSSQFDNSDGTSMRRFIERTSYNKLFDETTVVAELDLRAALNSVQLTGSLGAYPNFSIRKGKFKLLMPKKADSEVIDMMYNLEDDPFEMKNLLFGNSVSKVLIGKAEHLRILLIEWMRRNDSSENYYSDPKYNFGEGDGDIAEIRKRQTWEGLDFWISDPRLCFGNPVAVGTRFVRNEYLYMGKATSGGRIDVRRITVEGKDKGHFTLSKKRATFGGGDHVRLKVTYSNPRPIAIKFLKAVIKIETIGQGTHKVPICGETSIVFNRELSAQRDQVDYEIAHAPNRI